jgi:NADPH-dependent 2,4-dienoyl-CoA reductase/sulfur reductase-like enzyme/ferredoxin
MSSVPAGADTDFPNYTRLPAYLPLGAWHALRALAVAAALGLAALLALEPELGLAAFWGLVIPVAPLVFLVAPGVWRNVCPLAALNQLPRLAGFTRGLVQTPRLMEYAYVIGMAALLVLVATRKPLFNQSGMATAILILGLMGLAFLGGVVFKGKSGWCSSICPLLPVQRLYGQTPFLTVANTHCQPCVGCAKNCYDFNPKVAYLADQYDGDRHYVAYRRFFAAVFPGFVAAYFLVPDPPAIGIGEMYLQFLLYMGASLAAFTVLDTFVKTSLVKLPALFGIAALNIFYWYGAPAMAAAAARISGEPVSDWSAWIVRGGVAAISLIWLARTFATERRFMRRTVESATAQSARLGAGAAAALAAEAHRAAVEVTFQPEGRRAAANPEATLLEIAESCALAIEAGCRMGICGSDPVAVTEGMENLSPVGADEQATLDRLGFAANTRMACCARVRGPVSVMLAPDRTVAKLVHVGARHDASVERVVIVGNGIAGVTAADHVRRIHPDCEIHLVGRERYPLYNRMGITRLIYGRSAMQGLYLLPDAWYEQHSIQSWLNTRVDAIDLAARKVTLGTGESLEYDRLILAAGARSLVPQIEGFGARGSYVLRDAEHAMHLREYVQRRRARRAIVAGGGLLGLEAADGLRQLGLEVLVLERGPWPLQRQVDERGGRMLQGYLAGLGIGVLTEAEATAVEAGPTGVNAVRLRDGRTLPCEAFLACAGVRPDTSLAAAAGLKVNQGVVVDDRMQTSAPGVYAAGDLAEHGGRVYGIWPASVAQGEAAGVNAAGGERVYSGTVPATILKINGAELVSVGRIAQETGDEVISFEAPGEYRYARLLVREGRIAGAILIGHGREATLVGDAVRQGRRVDAQLAELRRGAFAALAA